MFQLWRRYDADNSGYIEADELKVSRPLGLNNNNTGLADYNKAVNLINEYDCSDLKV